MKKIEDILTRKPTDFLFFWGHTNKESRINKTCLSQWYDSPFIVDNRTFKTAEHYMMFKKAELFKNYPYLGKRVKSISGGVWVANRIVAEVCQQELLISTRGLRYGTFVTGTIDGRYICE